MWIWRVCPNFDDAKSSVGITHDLTAGMNLIVFEK